MSNLLKKKTDEHCVSFTVTPNRYIYIYRERDAKNLEYSQALTFPV